MTFTSTIVNAQVSLAFEKDFKKLSKKIKKNDDLFIFLKKYKDYYDSSSLLNKDFKSFKSHDLYGKNIVKLLNSRNELQQILALKTIGAIKDTFFRETILSKLDRKQNIKIEKYFVEALLQLQVSDVNILLPYVIKHHNEVNNFLLYYISYQNQQSLYTKLTEIINSSDIYDLRTKQFAIALLGRVSDKGSIVSANILYQSYNRHPSLRGYVLNALADMHASEVRKYISQIPENSNEKALYLKALTNSASGEDAYFVDSLYRSKDTATLGFSKKELLDMMFYTNNKEFLKRMLYLFASDSIPKGYTIYANDQPLLFDDDLLVYIQDVVVKIKNAQILQELILALTDRTDDQSIAIKIILLQHPDQNLRDWAADALKYTKSIQVGLIVKELLENKKLSLSPNIVYTTVLNQLTKQHAYFNINFMDTAVVAFQEAIAYYHANYPLNTLQEQYLEYMQSKTNEYIKQNFALALGALKYEKAYNEITKAIKRANNSGENFGLYLMALAQYQKESAFEEIKKYTKHANPEIAKIAKALLSD